MNRRLHRIKNSFNYWLAIACCCGFLAGDAHAQTRPSQAPALDIFLLIGQSNMHGVAPIESLDTLPLKSVWLFNDLHKWEPARNLPDNGMNRYSTVKRRPKVLFGPAYTFGRELAAFTGRPIGIVSNARGATRIAWWQKGYTGENDFDLFEEAIAMARAALAAAAPGSKIKGILWHQGEADNAPTRSPLYMDRLKSLVKDLRHDLGDSQLPFIAGEIGTWNGRGANINPVIRGIQKQISRTDWVSAAGLTSINLERNDAHFDNLSQRVFGGRYALKAANLIYQLEPRGAVLYNNRNYQGRSVLLVPGTYTVQDLESKGLLSSEIASIKLDRDYMLELASAQGIKRIKENVAQLPQNVAEIHVFTIREKSAIKEQKGSRGGVFWRPDASIEF